jgi:hypothetical protein
MPRLAIPSATRVRQLVRRSLAVGYYELPRDVEGPCRSYVCTLDMEEVAKVGDRNLAHRIRLPYWAGRPPVRIDIERAFADHYRDECPHTTDEGER